MKFAVGMANVIHKINRLVAIISAIVLLIMVFFVAVDVIGRYLINKPILGGMEIQELMMVMIVFLGFGIVTYDKQHVYVELLVMRFKGRKLATVSSLSALLSFIFVTLLIWQTAKYGLHELTSDAGTFTPILSIPIAPFILMASLGLLFMALEFLIVLITQIYRSANRSSSKSQEVLQNG